MWSWQSAYWDLLTTWGLIGPGWREGMSGAHFAGCVVGSVISLVLVVMTLIFISESSGFEPQGNKLWRTGAWMTAIVAGIAAAVLSVLLIVNISITLIALITSYPLLTFLGVLLVGPVLMLIGKLSWSKKSDKASEITTLDQTSSSSIQ